MLSVVPPAKTEKFLRLEERPELSLRSGYEGRWLVLGVLWMMAVCYVALTGVNRQRTAVAADRLEALYRASPDNVVGRGACAKYEATQPPVMYDPDSHCWINLTQQQIADGTVRPHDFPFDNTPYGRERHWSSSFSWWLLAVGGVTHLIRGLPLAQAVEQSAAWANPILFALFLAALALGLRRRLDAWATGVFLVTIAALSGVEWDFSYGRPDHHGLHLMAFLGLVLGALTAGLGWVKMGTYTVADDGGTDGKWHLVRPRPWAEARRWFTVSGVCGGIGLWIGSTQQCVCIGALGAGGVLGALLFARRANPLDRNRFEPELWRHWARVGAATSVGFYLLEYFPAHMAVHLEVNHPIMALGWLGAGELMYILLLAGTNRAAARSRKLEICARGVLGLLGMCALPLAVLFGPKAWWVLSDPLVLRSTQIITEGLPWLHGKDFAGAAGEIWTYTGALMSVVPLAVLVLILRRRQMPPWRQAGLAVALVLVGIFLGWTLLQNRWMGFLETSLAVAALLVAPCVPLPEAVTRRVRSLPLVLLALTLPGWVGFGLPQVSTLAENPLVHAQATLSAMMGAKEVAWNLRWYAAKFGMRTPARIMAPLASSPALHYYGGVDTVGSYYWENVGAYHVVVDFFTDEGDAEARHIARERQLDFVMVTTDPSFVLEPQYLKLGHTDVPAARRTLVFRLANPVAAQAPAWLEPLPLLDAPMAREQGMRIYRVIKERL